jgi:hypothetical protein
LPGTPLRRFDRVQRDSAGCLRPRLRGFRESLGAERYEDKFKKTLSNLRKRCSPSCGLWSLQSLNRRAVVDTFSGFPSMDLPGGIRAVEFASARHKVVEETSR